MSVLNKKAFFSAQLAEWLFRVDWHYVTLLGVSIECVDALPDDADSLINELLLQHSVKPSARAITAFLLSSPRLSDWFRHAEPVPKVTRFNLDSTSFTQPDNSTCYSGSYPAIDTPGDLADWLEVPLSQLDWFANLWRFDETTPDRLQHYQYQLLRKRDGRMRLIEKPGASLKRIQRRINHEILSAIDLHPAAHGFCKKRSCITHASHHVGKQYLLLYDISECFQSITWPMVKAVFRRMGYPERVCIYLTALCTHRVHLKASQRKWFDAEQKERLRNRHLPQGAPSSPALVNAVLYRFDQRLSGLAAQLGLDYSRYADDIAMSGNRHRDWRFLEALVGGICLDEGISLNHRKSRVKQSHQKQRVVGVVVNSKVNIDRRYFDSLKATLTNCKRYGLESQNREDHPHFRSHLAGRVQYVKSLNKKRGAKLERILSEIS